MVSNRDRPPPVDAWIAAYRFAKQVLLIVLLGLIVRMTLCDTVPVRTGQMAPAVLEGDRVVIAKARYAAPLRWFLGPRRDTPVVFHPPHTSSHRGCLRLVAGPGDVVSIDHGALEVISRADLAATGQIFAGEILPARYSPRDWMCSYRIPERGDTIRVNSLSTHDFIFLYSMILQEVPDAGYSFAPHLCTNDSLVRDYFVDDFALYHGKLSEVHDSLHTNWFFWDRMEASLRSSLNDDTTARLLFALSRDGVPTRDYVIRKRHYFLIADDWRSGFDSRYLGPICASRIDGSVVGVLWSFIPDTPRLLGLRKRRICKIIR